MNTDFIAVHLCPPPSLPRHLLQRGKPAQRSGSPYKGRQLLNGGNPRTALAREDRGKTFIYCPSVVKSQKDANYRF